MVTYVSHKFCGQLGIWNRNSRVLEWKISQGNIQHILMRIHTKIDTVPGILQASGPARFEPKITKISTWSTENLETKAELHFETFPPEIQCLPSGVAVPDSHHYRDANTP